MATIDELKTVLREALESRGVMNRIVALVRSEIFKALDDVDDPRPELTNENLIINELIRDYLEQSEYKHTLSVFLAEAGQPKERLSRDFLSKEISFSDGDLPRSKPLIFGALKRKGFSMANPSQANLTDSRHFNARKSTNFVNTSNSLPSTLTGGLSSAYPTGFGSGQTSQLPPNNSTLRTSNFEAPQRSTFNSAGPATINNPQASNRQPPSNTQQKQNQSQFGSNPNSNRANYNNNDTIPQHKEMHGDSNFDEDENSYQYIQISNFK